MILKKGNSITLPTFNTIHSVNLEANDIGSCRVYLSFLHNIDCLLCNVHIFNMAFESEKYLQNGTQVIFILNSLPKDVDEFVKEHPTFPFNIVINEDQSIFKAFKLPHYKNSLLGLKRQKFEMLDLLLDNGVVSNLKFYNDDKDHMSYGSISAFLKN